MRLHGFVARDREGSYVVGGGGVDDLPGDDRHSTTISCFLEADIP